MASRTVRGHEWTAFEKDTLLCLMCRDLHIIGFEESQEVTFGRNIISTVAKRRRKAKKMKDSKHAYMDVATALNKSVNNGAYSDDIPIKDVTAMIEKLLHEEKGAMAFMRRQPYGRITRSTKRVLHRGLNFIGDKKEWVAGRREKEAKLRLDRQHIIPSSLIPDRAGKDYEQVRASIESSQGSTHDWGSKGAPASFGTQLRTLDDAWDGANAVAEPTDDSFAPFFDEWSIVPADSVPPASTPALNTSLGGFGATTTATTAPAQSQMADGEWGGSWGKSATICLDNTSTDHVPGGGPVNAASNNSWGNFTPRSNNQTGPTWSSEQDDWGGHISAPTVNPSSLNNIWGGVATASANPAANSIGFPWDQPIPSTERPNPNPTPTLTLNISQTAPSSRAASGSELQYQQSELRSSSSEEALSGVNAPRNASFSMRRNERSTAPSPDLYQGGLIANSFGAPMTVNWAGNVDVSGNYGNNSANNDVADWEDAMSSQPTHLANNFETSYQWPTPDPISALSESVSASGAVLLTSGEEKHRQESSSQPSTRAQSYIDTPATTPTAESRRNSSITDPGINAERLAMLATLEPTPSEQEDTEMEDAEPENFKCRNKSKKPDNSNYMELPFNRLEK